MPKPFLLSRTAEDAGRKMREAKTLVIKKIDYGLQVCDVRDFEIQNHLPLQT